MLFQCQDIHAEIALTGLCFKFTCSFTRSRVGNRSSHSLQDYDKEK